MSISPTTLGNLVLLTQQRLEEVPGPPGVFWQYTAELAPLVVEALNEATLISGEPTVTQSGGNLVANSTLQPMPSGMVALSRIEISGTPIRKTTVWSLDRMTPGWQNFVPPASPVLSQVAGGSNLAQTYWVRVTYQSLNQEGPSSPESSLMVSADSLLQVASPLTVSNTVPNGAVGWNIYAGISQGQEVRQVPFALPLGTPWTMPVGGISAVGVVPPPEYTVKYWFPVGLTQWGITPQVAVSTPFTCGGIALPVNVPVASYTGSEVIQSQEEYCDSYADAAAAWARLKEGSSDFQQGLALYDDFLSKMAELSRYGVRKDQVLFSRALGVQAKLTDVSTKGS